LGLPPSVSTEPVQLEQNLDSVIFEDPSDVTEEITFKAQPLTVPQSQVPSDSQSTSEAHMKYQLELKHLELEERRIQAEAEERRAKLEIEKAAREAEREERRAQMALQERKLEMEKAECQAKMDMEKTQLQCDLRVLEINARARPAPDSQSGFKVETAAKLLPKLGSRIQHDYTYWCCVTAFRGCN